MLIQYNGVLPLSGELNTHLQIYLTVKTYFFDILYHFQCEFNVIGEVDGETFPAKKTRFAVGSAFLM